MKRKREVKSVLHYFVLCWFSFSLYPNLPFSISISLAHFSLSPWLHFSLYTLFYPFTSDTTILLINLISINSTFLPPPQKVREEEEKQGGRRERRVRKTHQAFLVCHLLRFVDFSVLCIILLFYQESINIQSNHVVPFKPESIELSRKEKTSVSNQRGQRK